MVSGAAGQWPERVELLLCVRGRHSSGPMERRHWDWPVNEFLLAIKAKLESFLHPCAGGLWRFCERFHCDILSNFCVISIHFPAWISDIAFQSSLPLCCSNNGRRERGALEWCWKGVHRFNLNSEPTWILFRSGWPQTSYSMLLPANSMRWSFWHYSTNGSWNSPTSRSLTMSVCCWTTMHCWKMAHPLLSPSTTRISSPQWR